GAESRTVIEQREPAVFDALEDPHAAQPGEPELRAQAAADAVADRAAFAEQLARDRGAALERPAPGVADHAARKVVFAGAGFRAHLARDVQPTGTPVASEVLPEDGQLERRAQGVRRSIERLVAIAGDAEYETPDGVGRSTTVIEDVRP